MIHREPMNPDSTEYTTTDAIGEPSSHRVPLTPELVELYNTLLERPAHERAMLLDRLAGSDTQLRDAAQRLLVAEQSPVAGSLDGSVVDVNRELEESTHQQPGPLPTLDARFMAIRPIGHGASGDVYLGRQHEPIERTVAIKVLRPTEVRPSTIERMRREAVALGALDHPGIATFHDAGATDDGRPFIVTEWIDGPPIDRWCDEHRAGFDLRCRLISQVCRAVEHAHQRGVIHRDLKPGNILVAGGDAGGEEEPRPKIVDLGIARLVDPRRKPAFTLTGHGNLLGTIGYIAPEQLKGGAADVRSDLFALGRILEFLLESVPAPSSMRSKDARAIVRQATADDPRDRYQSAGAMAQDIESMLAGRVVLARRQSLAGAATRLARRNPGGTVALVVGVVLVATAGGVAIDRSLGQAKADHDRAEALDAQKVLLTETLDGIVVVLGRYAGTLAERAELAHRLETQLEATLALTPKDRDLRVLLARVRTEQARIALALGQRDRALTLAAGAADIMRREIDPATADIRAIRQLGLAIVVQGDCLSGLREFELAEGEYRFVLNLHRRAHERFPTHVGLLDDLNWSLDRFSQPLHTKLTGDEDDRAVWAEHARTRLDLAHELLALDPDRFLSRFNLAVAYLKMGRIYDSLDDERAESYLAMARDALRVLCEEDPGRTSIHAYLSTAWSVLAEIYHRLGQDERALFAHEQTIEALVAAIGSQPGSDASLSRQLRRQAQLLANLYALHGRQKDIDHLRDRVDIVAPPR